MAIAQAIPAGHVRARGQHQWLAEVRARAGTAHLRADAHRNLLAVARALAAYANWEDLTSWPTWEVIQESTGLSRRTVARWLAWLRGAGLLATVVHGTTSDFSPGILRAEPGEVVCEAAVYVLIYRPHLAVAPEPDKIHEPEEMITEPPAIFSVDENGTPSESPKGTTPAYAREGTRHRQDPDLDRPAPAWPGDKHPTSKAERHLAAVEARRHNPLLRLISTAYVAALFREAHLAGWTVADILHALDTQPDGSPWPHTAAVRHVPGFVRYRLAAWRNTTGDGSGPFLPSPSQRAAAEQNRLRALARARAEAAAAARAAATPATEAAWWADRVRAELLAARARRQNGGSQ